MALVPLSYSPVWLRRRSRDCVPWERVGIAIGTEGQARAADLARAGRHLCKPRWHTLSLRGIGGVGSVLVAMCATRLNSLGLVLLLCANACSGESQDVPSPASSARTLRISTEPGKAAKTPKAAVQLRCFGDGSHEICLEEDHQPSPLEIYIDGIAVPVSGQWRARSPRVPSLSVHLLTETGPALSTGPNGALRIVCPGGMRQYFKGERRSRGEVLSHGAENSAPPQRPCGRLGLSPMP